MIIASSVLILLIGLLVYMVKPNKRRLGTLPTVLFAHRGLHGDGIPENSLTAFKEAAEEGFGVELDVRLTLDKKLVVFHDNNLERMCGADKKISEMTYEDLQAYRLLNTNETIPLYSDVLTVLDGAPLICEIKSFPGEALDEICEAVCRETEAYKGFSCIESFNPFVVQWFRNKRPDIIRGQLSMDFMKEKAGLSTVSAFAMKHLLINSLGRPDFVAYRFEHDALGFLLCRKIFKPILMAWTVVGEKACDTARKKFHGVIFEKDKEV